MLMHSIREYAKFDELIEEAEDIFLSITNVEQDAIEKYSMRLELKRKEKGK